ncbi:MauE/DoxX family redox-associated membrane protein [Cryptosporangium japonicum]|uniref:Methylamine utilization protein MauE n=1 Tax=Cryptosporangium japonicum TaxID=80872 RepID=A0ABP3DSR7_9ACTN
MRYLVLVAAATLWVVFAVSAVSKLRGRAAYAAFVASTGRLLPPRFRAARPAALLVVVAELVVVATLPVVPVAGLVLGAALLGAFGVAILGAVRRGVTAPCRCFGASARPLGVAAAVRNGLLAVLATGGAAAAAAVPAPLDGAHPAGVAIAAFGALVLAVLTISFDDVADLLTPGSVAVDRT